MNVGRVQNVVPQNVDEISNCRPEENLPRSLWTVIEIATRMLLERLTVGSFLVILVQRESSFFIVLI